jgi:hypothetical protein
MGLIGCPETSVKDYNWMMRNIPEQRRSSQHRGGSTKFWIIFFLSLLTSSLHSLTKCINRGSLLRTSFMIVDRCFEGLTKLCVTGADVIEANIRLERVVSLIGARKTYVKKSFSKRAYVLHQMLVQWPKKQDEMGGACTRVVEMRNAWSILVGKGGGKTPLGSGWRTILKIDS